MQESLQTTMQNYVGIVRVEDEMERALSEIEVLKQRADKVGVPGNRGSGATQTTITYGPDKADSARTLAAALPGSVVQEDPSLDRTLEVVVGSGYTGAKAVTVTGTPAPSSSASPKPKVVTAQDTACAP